VNEHIDLPAMLPHNQNLKPPQNHSHSHHRSSLLARATGSRAFLKPESKSELWLLLGALTFLYIVIVSVAIRRIVWFDELLTFDIASATTIHQMWDMIRKLDFQPPVGYLLSRLSMKILGRTALGLRLPSIIEFYCASLAFFFYVRRKVGSGYAAAAVLLLWVGQTSIYTVEARPYALLLMMFAILLLSWDVATTSKRRNLALSGVAFSNLGMISAHVFAPLSLLPFLVAEGVRFFRTRRADFVLWAGLLIPLAAISLYLPLISSYGTITFPPEFQASLRKIPHFYYATISPIAPALLLALCAALLTSQERPGPRVEARPEEIVLFGSMFIVPVVLITFLITRRGAFWDRYAITTEAIIYIAMAILLAFRLGRSRYAGYAAAAVLLVAVIRVQVWAPLSVPRERDASVLASVRPELPLVVAGGVTFFEMNHHEGAKLLSRIYFLKNRSAAMRYTNTNLFEDRGFPDHLYPGLRISANVAAYDQFLTEHREFLVLGNFDAPEEWLLKKLKDDGARIIWLGTYPVPYVDSNLYLVSAARTTARNDVY
jgi:hypothetical protein